MALSGIQIFKMTPKKNCKECGCPTCMAIIPEGCTGRYGYFSVPIYV